ncbi:MAG: hypothetical protein B6244_11075 [Candidatus Cloacimonetes bacterium 4572_55]|nr:MAG: hypothetical protein B6244_11075 [Candidatus Cloacimonetes bacterium 4572_55]
MLFPSTPISYAVEITYACNNRCPGCANSWRSQKQLTLRDWETLFDRISPLDKRRQYAQLIRITGGEPTLHPNFSDIIRHIDGLGVAHALFTNGRWSQPDKIVRLYQECQNSLGMLVSLHGSRSEDHNFFIENIDGAFEETCRHIRMAADAGIELFTNTVLTNQNYRRIEEVIALSQKLGASFALFNRLLGKYDSLKPSEQELRQAVMQIEKLRDQGVRCRIGNCVPPCFTPNSTEGGNSGIEHCAISPTGDVRPDNVSSRVFGNIFRQSIEEIWASEDAVYYRENIPEICRGCLELCRCRGGHRTITNNGEITQDPLITRSILEKEDEIVKLNPGWTPFSNFALQKEPFGYILARYNWSTPVSFDAKPILDAIDGEKKLWEIEDMFGREAVDLIGYLSKQGFIGFE